LRHFLFALTFCAAEASGACTSTVVPVVFGSYNPLSGQNADSTGAVDMVCVPPAPYTISLSPGQGSYDTRNLMSGSFRLGYNLYTSVSRSVVWGDGTSGTATVNGNAATANYTIYARIPANQNVGVGAYSDSVLVTVSF
jgi:spore coat protein U-like protein